MQYIKGTKNILAVFANLLMQIDWPWLLTQGTKTCTYTVWRFTPQLGNTQDTNSTDTFWINVLENTNIVQSQDIKTLKGQEAYCKCLLKTLYILSVHNKFIIQDNILYTLIQDGDKPFEALVVDTSLALTMQVNSHNYQGHASTNKMYFLIKKRPFGRECE